MNKSSLVTLDVYNLGQGNVFTTGKNCLTEKLRLEFRGNKNMVFLVTT